MDYTDRDAVLFWFRSDYVHRQRPDLVELLPDTETVTLTYAQLRDMVETVRYNSRQR